MDVVSQLQDQANHMASLFFNYVGALQRDAPPVRLGDEPPPPPPPPEVDVKGQGKMMATAVVQAAKTFDALVGALPVTAGGEEEQLKRIAELQAENEAVANELQSELSAMEAELAQVREVFHLVVDHCLRKPKVVNAK
ncbi:hypothetical protein CBR_g6572 [Chara braunii]|uniref:Mediator of RNA polymerase II transcription subunit 21 n=1 Tax=Chara braunii TaxID=69332 RepID=A0A388KK69_CHABU|nr:hypothetical protein CBR_g6572 [Chara braunii]|eukprot:GBG70444.1 hypothetical protein CBR_g6572 [Chara braunii]